MPALRLRAPSVRFIALAIFATGVRAFECALSSLTSSFDHGLRCAVVFFAGTNNLLKACLGKRDVPCLHLPRKGGVPAEPHLRGRGEYIVLAAWPQSGQQFRLLRGKLRLGQNAPGLQFGHPLYCSEDVLLSASRSAGRALLLRGALMHRFAKSSFHSRRRRPAGADVNAAELAGELREPDPGCCCENPLI